VEYFARRPQIHGVSISADGRYVAYLSGANDETVLTTLDRSQPGGVLKRVTSSEPGRFDIGWCRWANDRRLLCGLHGNIRGSKYAELPFKRMFAVDADGAALKTFEQSRDVANTFVAKTSVQNFSMHEGGPQGVNRGASPHHYANWHMSENSGFGRTSRAWAAYSPERQDELLDITPDDKDTVLVQFDDDKDSFPSIFQLNIYSGNSGVRFEEVPPIRNFISDGRGNPRIGWGSRDLKTTYYVRREGDRDWRPLGATNAFSTSNPLYPIAVAPGSNNLYAVGAHQGRDALWSVDLADQREPQLLFHHPLVDVGEPILQTDRRLLGVRYDVERPYVWYADAKQRELVERLDSQYPSRGHEIIDSSQDRNFLIIRSSSDVDLGTYFLYDSANSKMQKLGTAYPELNQGWLGMMTPITYKASDGTTILGYLTIPSRAERKNLPLVVMPHDGPSTRDTLRFSFLRTFLANRGYAVLQMNYRGSAGFGQKWRLDALQEWGGLVYSDIHDATRWAISEGIADPTRICIAGWGFGGYAALLGAVRNADTYRCAVSIAGISDLEMYQQHGALSGQEEYRRAMIGTDREKLKLDSPVEQAAQIRVPVLLVHGTRDWQVQMDHSNAMAKALKKQDKLHQLVIIKNGSHELERQSDRVTLLKEVETFLREHLGPGVDTEDGVPSAGSPAL
jgi:dipeptidyl aminopeptidase/acylaminoacyl peptidase